MSLYSARLLLSLTLIIGVIAGCGCNGDDPPPKPPNPTGITAVNGDIYKGTMRSTLLDQPLEFGVKNSGGDYVADQWIHFSLLEGDGALSADSIKSGSNGLVTLEYNFSGDLGHATIRAIARNLDTTEVYLRANVLIPGEHGQGQYVLLDDTYGDVLDFNGQPVSVHAAGLFVEADYRATQGVMFELYDINEDGLVESNSPIYGVRVVDSVFPLPPDSIALSARYAGMTLDSIQIGSSYWRDIMPIYGVYDSAKHESEGAMQALVLFYGMKQIEFWCDPVDTVAFQIFVHEQFDPSLYIDPPVPENLVSINGLNYRGSMGTSILHQLLQFAVITRGGSYLADQWIHFALLEGDGSLSADSLKSGSNGLVTLEYNFSGDLGHAIIRAISRNLDTTEVYLRANVLIPGDHGQGQYVLLDDTYGDVVDFNGPPVSVDTFPQAGIAVANYEATLGVVVVIYDTDENGVIEASSPVFSVIVVDSVYLQPDGSTKSARYEGTTVDGIGIGSHWWDDVIPILGYPSPPTIDDSDPNLPSHKVQWPDLRLTLWCHRSGSPYQDSTIYQIDIAEEFDVSLYDAVPSVSTIDSVMRLISR